MTDRAVILVILLYYVPNIYLYQKYSQEIAGKEMFLLNTFQKSSASFMLINRYDIFNNYDEKESTLKSSSSQLMLESGCFFGYYPIFNTNVLNTQGI